MINEPAGCWVTLRWTAAAVVCAWKKASARAGTATEAVASAASARATQMRAACAIAASHPPSCPCRSRIGAYAPDSCQHAAVTSRPRVIAHRGASEAEAEHTLAAYQRALADGADGLECDVRLTRDGVLVCMHDRRVDRTSSGRGVLSTLELADLADLDFGSWYATAGQNGSGTAEAPDWDRKSVLTLSRLLEVVADSGREVELAIETKHPTRYSGLVELTLSELLAHHGFSRPRPGAKVHVRVMSFATSGLRRLRHLAPALPTVYLMDRLPLRLRDGTLPAGAMAAGPSLRVLRNHPDYVERVHAAGAEVHVWTVDDPVDVSFVTDLGRRRGDHEPAARHSPPARARRVVAPRRRRSAS